jgi:hypothetical protein
MPARALTLTWGKPARYIGATRIARAVSSAGRALRSHRRGHWFKSSTAHHFPPQNSARQKFNQKTIFPIKSGFIFSPYESEITGLALPIGDSKGETLMREIVWAIMFSIPWPNTTIDKLVIYTFPSQIQCAAAIPSVKRKHRLFFRTMRCIQLRSDKA